MAKSADAADLKSFQSLSIFPVNITIRSRYAYTTLSHFAEF
jgi:hypothetical protein